MKMMGAELLLIYELTIETYALLGNKDKDVIYFSALKNFFIFSSFLFLRNMNDKLASHKKMN